MPIKAKNNMKDISMIKVSILPAPGWSKHCTSGAQFIGQTPLM